LCYFQHRSFCSVLSCYLWSFVLPNKFPLWPRILSISLCIYWPLVLLFSIICSVHLPTYSVGYWFFVEFFF
jgi:hypothetical protein